MFKAELAAPVCFAKIVKTLHNLLDVVNIDFSPEGLEIQAIDAAQVFAVELVLHAKTAFRYYVCGERNFTVGLRLSMLHRALRNVKKGDKLVLWIEDPGLDTHFNVTIWKNGSLEKQCQYKLSQITLINQERMHFPDREYTCEVLMPPAVFVEMCGELNVIGEKLTFKLKDGAVTLSARNEMMEAKTTTITEKDANDTLLAIHCKEQYTESFKFSIVHKIAKGCASFVEASAVLLQLGAESPLGVVCQLEEMGHCKFFIAPLLD